MSEALRFLLDENVPAEFGEALRRRGHDVLPLPPALRSAGDSRVLREAKLSGRRLVTMDKDFGDLVFLRRERAPEAVILLRLRPAELLERLAAVAGAIEATAGELSAFIVIGPDDVRVRPMRTRAG